MKQNVWGASLAELQSLVTGAGFPKFRAKQMADYLYRRGVSDFSAMLQLPQPLRAWLIEHAAVEKPEVIRTQTAPDGETEKLLLRLADGALIETVLMRHDYGNSVCVSTQVGCAMGCAFCASTQNGLARNLTAAEMLALAELYAFREKSDGEIHSVVLMGSGEPLQNYENVIQFIHLAHDPDLLNLSYRGVTLSTCGIVPGIDRLADENIPITLAISLHAPNDEIRHRLLPISRQYAIEDVVAAARRYFEKTGRRVTFEYILIDGVNASDENAAELCRLLGDLPCHVNLIPVNGTEHIRLFAPSGNRCERFRKILETAGKSATLRRKMGDEIQAACGQLKKRQLETE